MSLEIQEYFIIISKYMITLFIVLYALESFLLLLYKSEDDRGFLYLRQNVWMFLMQLTAFVNLSLATRNWNYVYLYGLVQILLFGILLLTTFLYKRCNRLLLNHMCMLLGIGMIMLARLSAFDTAETIDSFAAITLGSYSFDFSILLSSKAFRQYVIICISFAIGIILPALISRAGKFYKLKWLYATAGLLLLSTVLILGEVTKGSKLSYTIKGITFQPSEFVKILFVFFIAAAVFKDTGLKNILVTSIFAGIHVILLVLSTDLGSALIFFVCFITMIFVASRNLFYLLLGLIGGASASIIAYFSFSHVRIRVLAWLDPWSYIDNKGYQITQSLFAIGSGSWFGMGLNEGNPKAIPYVDVDFIFSSICEELGVIFGIFLIIIIVNCFLVIMQVGIVQNNLFYKLICVGLGTIYIFQVFLTIGGGIKFIPLTGVTLPFISYGGSSVMTTMIQFFIVQGIYINYRKEQEFDREE